MNEYAYYLGQVQKSAIKVCEDKMKAEYAKLLAACNVANFANVNGAVLSAPRGSFPGAPLTLAFAAVNEQCVDISSLSLVLERVDGKILEKPIEMNLKKGVNKISEQAFSVPEAARLPNDPSPRNDKVTYSFKLVSQDAKGSAIGAGKSFPASIIFRYTQKDYLRRLGQMDAPDDFSCGFDSPNLKSKGLDELQQQYCTRMTPVYNTLVSDLESCSADVDDSIENIVDCMNRNSETFGHIVDAYDLDRDSNYKTLFEQIDQLHNEFKIHQVIQEAIKK